MFSSSHNCFLLSYLIIIKIFLLLLFFLKKNNNISHCSLLISSLSCTECDRSKIKNNKIKIEAINQMRINEISDSLDAHKKKLKCVSLTPRKKIKKRFSSYLDTATTTKIEKKKKLFKCF